MSRLPVLLLVGAALGCATTQTTPPRTAPVGTVVTLHRRPIPSGTAVTYAWNGVMHGHVRVEGAAPKKVDLFLRESRTTKATPDEMLVRWNEKATRTVVDGGEPKIEVSPLVGKSFRLVKAKDKWWIVDADGNPCKTPLCQQALTALDVQTHKLEAAPPQTGPSLAHKDAPHAIAYEQPLAVGEQFDDASILFGTSEMNVDSAQATLDDVEGSGDDRKAKFSVDAALRMGVGEDGSIKVRAKGTLAVYVASGQTASSKLEGTFRLEGNAGDTPFVMDGRMRFDEQWTYVPPGG